VILELFFFEIFETAFSRHEGNTARITVTLIAIAFVLGLSIFLQILAAIMALRLIRVTGGRIAWSLIAVAILLMAIRRSLTFYHLVAGEYAVPPPLQPELIALIISFLIFAGVALLEPMFRTMQRVQAEHKEIEAAQAVHQRHAREFQKMESLGKLAGGIAHHFNNALFGILGLSEIAMDDIPEGNPAREKIEKLRRVALDAKDIVSQIVAFSRQSPPEYQPLDLAQTLTNGLPLLYAALPSAIKIEQDIAVSCPPVLADENQIKQILFNLASNAGDAIGDQTGVITLKLAPVSLEESLSSFGLTIAPGDYLCLSVQDTGGGISGDQLANIFDPFFTTKEVGQGSGMGLAVVHGFVTGHKGAITVDTAPDRGTTFHVFLPVAQASAKTTS